MRIPFILFSLLLLFQTSWAQEYEDLPVTLETPYNTVYIHLHYLQPDSYEPAKAARAIYGVADSVRARRLAIQLKQILDGKGLYVRLNKLPQDPNFVEDSISNRNVYTLFPKELPEVFLEKVDGLWYYSPETVKNIKALHQKVYPFGTDRLLNMVPKVGHKKVLGLALWQYLGLLILLTAALLFHALLSRILNPVVRRLTRSKLYPSLINPEQVSRIASYASILIVLRLIHIFLPPLQLPIQTTQFAVITIRVITILLVLLILLQVVEMIIAYFKRYTTTTESKMDEQLVPILKRTLQAIIIIIGIVQTLSLLDVDVTTLIAGISIGGLALALAAQDTLKNLFGSLTIFLDRPFQIGDWINFSDVDGTVEEVGFRSTRVRTFANSLVYVPNGRLADMVINNYGLRIYRRFNTKITIAYSTPPELIDAFVKGIRHIIANHPDTRKDAFEVHLNDMSASSLDILLYTFFAVPTWSEELKGKQEVLLAIIRLAHSLGVQFAFPSTSIYVETFPGQLPNSKPSTDEAVIQKKLEEFASDFDKKHKQA
jgi:MscS family membrane protein